MGRARCTLEVRGLDCAVEVAALRSALDGRPGVGTLGFDLIHGMMTVDYDPEATEPAALVRRIAARAGHEGRTGRARPRSSDGWWSRNGRWASTAASGLALLAGVLIHWLGGLSDRGHGVAYALAVVAGGLDLVPRAARSLRHFRLDIHVLMGSAVLGAIALGQWDEAATVAFLFGLSESLEALSVDRARRAVRALLEVTPESAERIEAGRVDRDRARLRDRHGGPGPGPVGRAGPGGRLGRRRAGRASTRRRSPASRCRSSARSATACSPARSTAKGRWRSRRRGRSTTP